MNLIIKEANARIKEKIEIVFLNTVWHDKSNEQKEKQELKANIKKHSDYIKTALNINDIELNEIINERKVGLK